MTAEQPQTCRERILAQDRSFTRTDRRIVGFLLSDYPFGGLRNLKELATATGTGTATVLRLVAKLGYDGYPAFQREIRAEIQDRFQSPLSRFGRAAATATEGPVLARAAVRGAALMEELAQTVTPQEFEDVARLLANSKRSICLLGGRYSHSLADLFDHNLSSLRPDVTLVEATPRGLLRALDAIGGRHVVFLFDFQRYQPDLLQFCRSAKASGATVILMTDSRRSPCQHHADHVLAVPTESLSPFVSGVAALLCLEALIARISECLGDAGKARLEYIDRLSEGGEDAEGTGRGQA